MVHALLVEDLELLENVWRLRLPLARGIVDPGARLALLFATSCFFGFFLGGTELSGHVGKITLGACRSLHLGVTCMKLAKRLLNISLDFLRQSLVGGGGVLDPGNNALPWHLENTGSPSDVVQESDCDCTLPQSSSIML